MKRAAFLLVAGMAMLGGCVSFGGKPPASLMTLTAETQLPANANVTAVTGDTLVVVPPITPQLLASDRVAVRTSPTEVAYLADARWSEVPARLFADLLSETIAARTGRAVLDRRQFGLAPGARLSGRLNAFEMDVSKGAVVLNYDAALNKGDGQPLQIRRFEISTPSPSEKPEAVARAFNEAANKLAAEVADWIGK